MKVSKDGRVPVQLYLNKELITEYKSLCKLYLRGKHIGLLEDLIREAIKKIKKGELK